MSILANLLKLLLLVSFMSCGSIRLIGLREMSKMINKASQDIQAEGNWDVFKGAVLPQLKLIEGLLNLDPENENFLIALAKGYGAYALSVEDTLLLEDELAEREGESRRKRAIYFYEKSVSMATRYLATRDIHYSDIFKNIKKSPQDLKNYLDKNLDADDMNDKEAILFLGQSLGGLLNHSKRNYLLMAQLPVVKHLFDWLCEKDPDIWWGSCQIFYGSYEVNRPKTLGGDPNKGKEIFAKAFKKYPQNLLARVLYLQFYAIPFGEEKEFKKQKSYLVNILKKVEKRPYWTPQFKKFTENSDKKNLWPAELNHMNAMALKRFKIMLQFEKNLF